MILAWLFELPGGAAIVEILVFAIGIYAILRFLRTTRGAGVIRGLSVVLLGVIISFTILIESFELSRLRVVFENFRDIAVLGLIVVFQPEIRRAIVRLGDCCRRLCLRCSAAKPRHVAQGQERKHDEQRVLQLTELRLHDASSFSWG